jgi:hypothetical protein
LRAAPIRGVWCRPEEVDAAEALMWQASMRNSRKGRGAGESGRSIGPRSAPSWWAAPQRLQSDWRVSGYRSHSLKCPLSTHARTRFAGLVHGRKLAVKRTNYFGAEGREKQTFVRFVGFHSGPKPRYSRLPIGTPPIFSSRALHGGDRKGLPSMAYTCAKPPSTNNSAPVM